MSAYSNLHSEPTQEDRLVRQVVAACAKHGVAYGSPDDLRGFLRALDNNKHLAMDFWSMVARMSERGAVEESDWLLNVIVEGVTGQTLANLTAQGSTYQQPIQRLRSLLAGEDVRPPAPAPADRKPVRAAYSRAAYSLDPVPTPPSPYAAGRRLSLEPDPPVATVPTRAPQREDPHKDLNWVIPLESYSESNKNSGLSGQRVVGALAAIVLLGSAAFVVQYHERLGNSIHAGASSAIDAWYGSPAVPAATPKPATVSPSTQLQPAGNLPRNMAPLSQPPAPAPTRDTQTQPSDRRTSNLTTSDQPSDLDTAMPATGGGRVVVPEILMRQNLISSPTPASAYGHGRVVMQAIVTKHGNVSHIHVVSGSSALRQTAIDAALSRRYQPYLLNGTPVDVSTTITLDF